MRCWRMPHDTLLIKEEAVSVKFDLLEIVQRCAGRDSDAVKYGIEVGVLLAARSRSPRVINR